MFMTLFTLRCCLFVSPLLGLGVRMEDEIICTGCGWIGSVLECAFLNGWNVCPKCESPDDLINGEDLDELDTAEECIIFNGVAEVLTNTDFVMMESYESEESQF